MATDSNDVDEIRHQMAKLRSDLHHDMREVVAGATAATDWRLYIRKRPLGGDRRRVRGRVPRGSPPLHRRREGGRTRRLQNRGPAPQAQAKEPRRGGTLGWLLRLAVPVITRVAQGYVLNTVENLLVSNPPHRVPTGSWPEHVPGQPGTSNSEIIRGGVDHRLGGSD